MGIETALLTLAIGTTAGSIYSTYKAGQATAKAAKAQEKRAEIENIRAVRQAIRQAALARGAMTNQAALTGGMGGSGLAGGLGSVGSQLAGNLNFMSDVAEQNTKYTDATLSAAKHSTNAAVLGQVGSVAGTIFDAKGGWKTVFGT